MKRFRVKLAGFGLAVIAGSAVAADGEWQAAGKAPPARVVQAGGQTADPRPETPDLSEPQPVWLPASDRTKPPPAPPAAQAPAVLPAIPIAPASPVEPVPKPAVTEVPGLLPIPRPQPALPRIPPAVGSSAPRPALQQPAPLAQPRPMVPPSLPGNVLPVPRPVTPALPQAEPGDLPVAPPELMVPAGATLPDKHHAFGSMPIRLSRDYPSLADMHGGSFRERAGLRDGDGLGGGAAPYNVVEQGYVQGEYLMWWASPLNIPILATTNTQGGFGFLGEPGTVPILGPGQFIGPFRQGFRVRGGLWLGEAGSCALDGSFFFLGQKNATAVLPSSEFPIITRPVFSPNPAGGGVIGQTGEAVAVPNVLTGSLSAQASSVIWGFDANIRKCLCTTCDSRWTWLVGFRNLNLQESITVTENINVVGTDGGVFVPDPVGSVVKVQDRFATKNSFYGGQVGLTYVRNVGRFSLDTRATVALGDTHQELTIDGYQVRTRPGMAPMTFRGGLLAAGPNLGTFSRDQFSVVPELTMNLGFRVTPNLKVYAGYNFIYWSNVIRPGDQIDGVVDLSFVPNAPSVTPSGLNRPRPPFKQSDLWITGVQFGLEGRW